MAFVVARFSFWFNLPMLVVFTAANLLPQQALLVPLYRLFRSIQVPFWFSDSGTLYDSYWAVIIIHIAFQTGFCTFVLSNYMKTLPAELTEAALVDGAGVVRQFFQITLPLCRPALAALATLLGHLDLQRLLLGDRASCRPATSSRSPARCNNLQGPVLHRLQPGLGRLGLVAIPTLVIFFAAAEAVRLRPDPRAPRKG